MLESMRRFKAGVFQALAHPTRVAIVEYLDHGELSLNQLCEKVGVEQANASQHLAILRNKHIVQARKAGNQTFYRLRDPAFGKVLAPRRRGVSASIPEGKCDNVSVVGNTMGQHGRRIMKVGHNRTERKLKLTGIGTACATYPSCRQDQHKRSITPR
jgi:ArsR family transcriptional regulator